MTGKRGIKPEKRHEDSPNQMQKTETDIKARKFCEKDTKAKLGISNASKSLAVHCRGNTEAVLLVPTLVLYRGFISLLCPMHPRLVSN